MRWRLSIAALFLASSGLFVGAQTSVEVPGGITLLPGYQHERGRGADSRVGRISHPRGFEIRYDIGAMAGNYATNPRDRQWLKEQVLRPNRVHVAMSTNRVLTVSFSAMTPGPRGPGNPLPANFFATIKTDEDIADMLLMTLSYKPN